MSAVTRDILPYHLRCKQWEAPRQYTLTISRDKRVSGEQTSIRCSIPLTLNMEQLLETSAVVRLRIYRPYFNGNRDYNKWQWIFARLLSLSRELHIRTRRSGAVREILNEQQIQKQWPGVKQQLTEMYDDPLVEELLSRHEHNLFHHFHSLYGREPVLQFLCNDLFRSYSEETAAETKKILPRHLGTIPFPLIERKQLTRLEPRHHEAEITVDGCPDTERIDAEAVNRYLGQVAGDVPVQPYQFTYRGAYRVNTSLGCISEASLQVEGAMGETYQKNTTYHLTATDHE
ncbi:hypothetical protein [Fodinibius sp.]|uniref:hypothetical protein n=1 Tax=Fodinibius sp. TaxID=1872440 RepID=UPI003566BB9B